MHMHFLLFQAKSLSYFRLSLCKFRVVRLGVKLRERLVYTRPIFVQRHEFVRKGAIQHPFLSDASERTPEYGRIDFETSLQLTILTILIQYLSGIAFIDLTSQSYGAQAA
jgi:hypothetical protein